MSFQLDRQANLLSDCIDSLKLWIDLINKYSSKEDKQKETLKFQKVLKDFCLIDIESIKITKQCEKLSSYFQNQSTNNSIDVEQVFNSFNESTNSSINYQQNRIWIEVMNPYDGVQEIKQKASVSSEIIYEELGDQLFCSSVFTPPLDPISKRAISDPYKSKTCGHIYEYKLISQYIKNRKDKAKCPYIGCTNKNLTVEELVQDKDTRYKIEQYKINQTPSSTGDQTLNY